MAGITRQELDGGLDALVGQLTDSLKVAVNLSNGLQIVNNTGRQSVLKGFNLKGKTAQLNQAGGRARRYQMSGTTTLNVGDNTTGSSTDTVNVGITNAGEGYLGYTHENSAYKVLAGRLYLVAVDMKINSVSGTGNLNVGGNFGLGASNADKTKIGVWQRVYHKATMVSDTEFTMLIGTCYAAGNYATANYDVKNPSVIEITTAEWNAFDTLTAEQKVSKYPYTEGIQGTWNPYVLKYGENLLPPFSQWVKHAESKFVEPYKLQLTASGQWAESFVDFPVLPNTTYSFSVTITGGGGGVVVRDKTNNYSDLESFTTDQSGSFTTGATTREIRFILSNNATGTITFTNPMLNIGSTELTFEPRVDDMLAVQDTFYAHPYDGTYADELNEVGGKLMKTQNWHGLELTGDLAWAWSGDFAGFKEVSAPITGGVISSDRITKYNGKPLTNTVSASSADSSYLDTARIWIRIADTDSGWGEGYTPTADEIKAYFYGWRMADSSVSWTTPYNGTGTKNWITTNNGWTSLTLPTTPHETYVGSNLFYKLLYRLTTPVTYEVTSEGSMTLHEGSNQVETGVGIVVRERNGAVSTTWNTFDFNGTGINGVGNSPLKYRANKIYNIYESSKVTNKAIPFTDLDGNSYGNQRAFMPMVQYNKDASYTVTYTVLDLYKLSAPNNMLSATYAPNDKTRLDDVVEKTNRNEAMVRVLLNVKAEKNQPQWITPTLLNGWVNFDPAYESAGYYKDSSGYVRLKGLIKGGTLSGYPMFILPKGYRPKNKLYISTASKDTTERVTTIEIVGQTGVVSGAIGGNTWFALDGISFLAEQ